MLNRPLADEFGGHFGNYIGLVQTDDVLAQFESNSSLLQALFSGMSEEQALFRYAPGKWSLKEVLGHLADTERVMSYRMMRIARGDTTPLPGFEQDDYIAAANFDGFSVKQLLSDCQAVRAATISLASTIAPDAWLHKGTASNTTMSARAFACVIAGHELHHLNVVRDRYLQS
ncbi:DinB family protein [Paenibacillus sacheonensis]|uniref:DUF664 domain-containing protein n=1 Tax=Paenibacillus sacheonensis TaxID=742054 RepID=A0A7X4YLH8_9BACL|nr:DinB family protein [Paenibacillus sacheonensis]MBM7568330.1 hypothetical protein [Paenibacillus sacheonensis]NBC68487.1 DUF664 domain-containing protein [Paenibacillus sacheonensis]